MTSLGQTLSILKNATRPRSDDAVTSRLSVIPDFGDNPGQLIMKGHAPAGRAPKAPLVIVLHGCTQSADEYAVSSGWLDLADAFGFAVVAPEQTRANNPNLCFNWFEVADIRAEGGEAESIAHMIPHAIRKWDLDPSRVFIAGFSAGGAMTAVMLATHPDLFAGGAIQAGLPYGVASSVADAFQAMMGRTQADGLGRRVTRTGSPTGRWPTVSVWHGEADGVVRPGAGEAVVEQWRQVHGVVGAGASARTAGGRLFQVWFSDDGRAVVEHHRIEGLGHSVSISSRSGATFGGPSRYTTDTGVASCFEVALSWGIAERLPEEASVSAGSEPLLKPHRRPPTPAVATVINDALRSAGLLR
jgi:poly(hydroxyalkanoate) depolymerase family esterase